MSTTPATLDLSAKDLDPSRDFARHLDSIDSLVGFRDRFACPVDRDGSRIAYFAGNSLGLMPLDARRLVNEELDDWASMAVEGHLSSRRPWLPYHESLSAPGARLVGATPDEVVMMNTLTVNLHLMMVSFYRPSGRRRLLLMEEGAFPSDRYAIESHVSSRGLDPATTIVRVAPHKGESLLRLEDTLAAIERHADELALVLMGGVGFVTGQRLEMPEITGAAQRAGAICGWDLAHAVGNIPLSLHDWNADFAVWCSYKYLNSGPGAVAGAFVHERHGANAALPRYAGWWGNDPATRFRMEPQFVPRAGAHGWQLSNPPILSMAPLIASLAIFDEAGGMTALRSKSRVLTAYLEFLLRERGASGDAASRASRAPIEVVTPADVESRGCQLSLRVRGADAASRQRELAERGFWLDHRPPDVLRAAPTPLYNSFDEVWRLAEALAG
ncbi:MAG: kynureninase [Phycisphaerae bacterium]|nr:kynureninase [Phycisphaerae bacterium]